MEEIAIEAETVCGPLLPIDKILHAAGLCGSRSEAQRKIREGAVSIDGERVEEFKSIVTISQIKSGMKIRMGKRAKKITWEADKEELEALHPKKA